MQSSMVDFPAPVRPEIRNNPAESSGGVVKSISASAIDAILWMVSLRNFIVRRLVKYLFQHRQLFLRKIDT